MGKADLHVHTSDGDGLDSVEAVVEHAAHHTDLDVVAVTEHDNPRPGLRAREIAASRGLRLDVVPGVEITTLQGHLVALSLERHVPSLRPIDETIAAVREAGGFCFVPHPLSWLTRSVGAATLDRLAAAGLLPDALELANRTAAARVFLARARELNEQRHRLPAIGASDAHYVEAIGSAHTGFAGTTAEDLRAALASGAVTAAEAQSAPLTARRRLQVMALPVAGLSATPKALGWRRTAWSFVGRYGS
jgi:predicted metal-dependent phosphoesterase TrpH